MIDRMAAASADMIGGMRLIILLIALALVGLTVAMGLPRGNVAASNPKALIDSAREALTKATSTIPGAATDRDPTDRGPTDRGPTDPAAKPSSSATPSASALRKCVGAAGVSYTNGACPPGTRATTVEGAVTVIPAVKAPPSTAKPAANPAEASAATSPSTSGAPGASMPAVNKMREAMLGPEEPSIRAKMIDQVAR